PGSKPDKVSACYAHNGSCYVCDNSKDYIDCNADWLWNYNFPTHSWFKQVDCYDPFEEHSGQCPDGVALKKQMADFGEEGDERGDVYSIDLFNTAKYFDVLGRKVSKRNSTQQITYKKSNDKLHNRNTNDRLQRTIENIFEGINQRNSRRALFKRDDCGHLRGDYGIIENGQRVGGITCPDAGPLFSTPNVLDNKFLEETCIVKDCEYKKVWVRVGTTLQMSLTSIDYYVVDVGFVFPDGYVTTQNDHNAVEKHEKGHVEDFKCIVKKFPEETKYIEVEVEACNEKDALNAAITESVQPYLDEMKKEYDKRFKRATDRYHKKYDSFKYPEDNYVCPSDL
ncbi:MAG: hypothetical protein IJM92_15185, partial [Fibrobacter sp.]|uniref:hypothetical protein n=1 Tax=Fibrobacter sp. TaxID=35828 RepID=UPI0025BCCD26